MTIQLKSADQTHYDAIALGEVLMRIDPGQVPTARARTARIWHGGGETNVAEGLSYCFGCAPLSSRLLWTTGLAATSKTNCAKLDWTLGISSGLTQRQRTIQHRRQGDFAQWDQLYLGWQGAIAFGD